MKLDVQAKPATLLLTVRSEDRTSTYEITSQPWQYYTLELLAQANQVEALPFSSPLGAP
jgi:hypothetical protein